MASSVNKFGKTSLLLMLGQVCVQGFSLLRLAIIGHLLSPQDFGIAVTFTITVAILEMASNIGSDKLLVQAKEGNDTNLQNSAQFFSVLRGITSCILLLIAAPYVAMLFKSPQAESAFYLLALVPLIRGFVHFDVKRFQRDMRFFPNLFAEFVPQFVTCLLTFPIAFIKPDYSAVIYLILLQSLLLVLMTHRLATRDYKISFDKQALKRLIGFGWPLMFGGFLMFIIFQGDKFIIGIYYDMERLAVYSAAFMIVMTPALLVSNVLTSMTLPIFAKKQDDLKLLNESYIHATAIAVLLASIFTVFFTLYGAAVLGLVFGKHYQGYTELMAILGFMWALRILRIPATVLALSKGDTKVGLIANIFRTFALLGVFYCAIQQYSIETIAYAGCAGELLAVLVTLQQIKHKFGSQYRLFLSKVFLFLFSVITSMLYIYNSGVNFVNTLILGIAFLFLFSFIMLSIYRKLIAHEKAVNLSFE